MLCERKTIDIPKLFRLWNDLNFRREDIAREFRCSTTHVERVAREHGLIDRPRCRTTRIDEEAETPTREEIEQRSAEVRLAWSPERLATGAYSFRLKRV